MVVKVPLTFVIIVVHENKYNHRVQRETSYKEIYTLLHFFDKIVSNRQICLSKPVFVLRRES